MRLPFVKTLCLAALITSVSGCNDSSFQAQTKELVKNHQVKSVGFEGNQDGGTKMVGANDTIDFIIQAVGLKTINAEIITTRQPVDLYFVLDNTASMTDEIEAVKNSINAIVTGLTAKKIDISVGTVGFIDSFQSTLDRSFLLNTDAQAFQNYVGSIEVAQSNADTAEASLYAIQKAIELFQTSGRPNSVKMIMVITDAVGHNGSEQDFVEQTRDCSTNQTISAINNYAATLGNPEQLKFFYAVPYSFLNGASAQCPGYNKDQKGQMEEIFSQILPGANVATKGGQLKDTSGQAVWPLTGDNLSESLIPLIEKSTPQAGNSVKCIAESAVITDDTTGQTLHRWNAKDLVATSIVSGNELNIGRSFNVKRIKGTSQNITLTIQRCCAEATSLSNGSQCLEKVEQSIKYAIENI